MPPPSRVRPAHLVVPDLGVGLGLRAPHYQEILAEKHPIGFFEAISENYMSGAKKPLYFLDAIRERYPVVLHGVALSIGGPDELDRDYLFQLKALVDRVDPPWVTDHFCFSKVLGSHVHDLLPLPYTEEMVKRVAERARQVQDYLERPFGLENTSSYLTYTRSEMTEWQFVREVVERADIGVLFDVNNVYVSSYNHGFDSRDFIASVPHERILQIHMAGHTNHGTHIIDTHSGPCSDEVIRLYEETICLTGATPTLVEWDDAIPPLESAIQEVERIARAREFGLGRRPEQSAASLVSLDSSGAIPTRVLAARESLTDTQLGVRKSIENPHPLAEREGELAAAQIRFQGNDRLSPLNQIEIYRDQFWLRHIGSLREDFPGVLYLLGEHSFDEFARSYLTGGDRPDFSLRTLGREFPAFLRAQTSDSSPIAGVMAELEWAYIRAFDAGESHTLVLPELTLLSPEEWAQARFTLAASVTLLTFPYPVADLRRAILKGEAPNPSHLDAKPEHRVVYRHADLHLYDKEITRSAFALLAELAQGERLGSACEKVTETNPGSAAILEQNLATWFQEWTELGLLGPLSR